MQLIPNGLINLETIKFRVKHTTTYTDQQNAANVSPR